MLKLLSTHIYKLIIKYYSSNELYTLYISKKIIENNKISPTLENSIKTPKFATGYHNDYEIPSRLKNIRN